MKRKIFKLIAFFLACLMILSLAACGNDAGTPSQSTAQSSGTDDSSASDSQDVTEGSDAAEDPGSDEVVTLNYVSWMTKGEDIPLLDDFMAENANIRVVNQSLDGADYANLLNTMMLSGTIPDVFLCQQPLLGDLVRNGFIQPVDDIPGVAKQQEAGAINDLMSVDGRVYAYVLNGGKGVVFVYYNTLYFEANGLSPAGNQAEYEQLMRDIAALGDVPLIVSAGDIWSADYAAMTIYQDMALEIDIAGINSTELALLRNEIKVSDLRGDQFRKLAQFYNDGFVSPDALAMGWEQACQFFVDGGAQLFPMGNWVPGSTPVQESDPTTFQIGAFPLPSATLSDGTRHILVGTDRIAVLSAHSDHPEAARKLYEYIIRDDVLIGYLERQGLIGINVEARVDPVFEYSFNNFAQPDVTLVTSVLNMMPGGFGEMFWQYCADIFTGANIDELLSRIDDDFDAFMSTIDSDEYINAIEANR